MKESILDLLLCPNCRGNLALKDASIASGEIRSGILRCTGCDRSYPIVDFIARFLATDSYVDTFSFQWNKFYDVQMDILNQTDISENTFRGKTGGRPEEPQGETDSRCRSRSGTICGRRLTVGAERRSAWALVSPRMPQTRTSAGGATFTSSRRTCYISLSAKGSSTTSPDTEKAFKAIVPYQESKDASLGLICMRGRKP